MTRLPSTSQPPTQGGSKLVIIALVVALAAAAFNTIYLSMIRTQVQTESTTVYRLLRTKALGEKLESGDAEAIEVPERFQQSFKGAINNPEGFENRIGEVFTVTVPQGTILNVGHFTDDARFQTQVKPGHRRIDLEVNPKRLPSGLANGRHVDILIPLPEAGGQQKYFTMMENVRVVGVGAQAIEEISSGGARRVRNFRTISIEVLPVAAPIVAYLEDVKAGDFRILLRNNFDGVNKDVDLKTGITKEVMERIPNYLRP